MGDNSKRCQIGGNKTRWPKNLTIVEPQNKDGLAGATKLTKAANGDIFGYIWHRRNDGLKEETVRQYSDKLHQLVNFGLDLRQPESFKGFLASKTDWEDRTKANFVGVYNGFLKWLKIAWEPPRYKPVRKDPYIPTEELLDQIIARAGRKLAPFLQLLKETGMRRAEAMALSWIDVDFERKNVRITPKKNGNPRTLPLSDKALGMLQTMPNTSDRIFPMTVGSLSSNYYVQRKSLARKLNDPRILKIGLHTFRHWKATMEFHKTGGDSAYVQWLLGHLDLKSTSLYVQLDKALFGAANNEFHVKVAKSVDEACKLAEVGFEHWAIVDGMHICRKRK